MSVFRLQAIALLAALALAACTKAQTSRPCPDSQRPQCMTRVECSYDEARDCEVCRCAPPTPEPVPTPH